MAKFSITFVFNRKKKHLKRNDEALIQMRIYYAGKNKYFSTGRYIRESEWDKNRRQVKTHRNARAINQSLEKMKDDMQSAFDMVEQDGKTITLKRIEEQFERNKTGDNFIAFCKDEHKNDSTLEDNTKDKHLLMINYLESFQKNIPFDHIDRKFVIGFREWLLKQDKQKGKGKLSINYVNKLLRDFQVYYNKAEIPGFVDGRAFRHLKIVDVRKENVILTREEIQAIWDVDLSHRRSNVREQRDAFVFRCFTGLAYIDYITLRAEHFIKDEKGLWLIKFRHKTRKKAKNRIELPLDLLFNGEGSKIIEPYLKNKLPKANLFRQVKNKSNNENIRSIAEEAGISKHLTTHVARHTFKNLCRKAGYPIDVISLLMGHAPPKTTTHLYGNEDRLTLAGYLR